MSSSCIRIGDQPIGQQHPPFVIAEMSGNHNQSLDRALALVDAAAAAGANALKLQTYTADTITLNMRGENFEINDKSSLWAGSNLHDLYNQAHTPWEWHEPIMLRAKEHGIICFSSPFDETAVDFLEDLNAPAYKIASFENNHLPLIDKAASTGKPLIISTGMASLGELEQAVATARSAGCKDLILLKCTSAYPACPENINIRTMSNLREIFNCEVGLSDHTMGIGVAIAAVALGATIIEKHLTISRHEGGVDSGFSLEPAELMELVKESNQAWKALGGVKYGPTEGELKNTFFRRSIYTIADIEKGDLFSVENIGIIRPGNGAPTTLYPKLIGKRARRSYKRGTPLNWDVLL